MIWAWDGVALYRGVFLGFLLFMIICMVMDVFGLAVFWTGG
jgi:hypothetical protein